VRRSGSVVIKTGRAGKYRRPTGEQSRRPCAARRRLNPAAAVVLPRPRLQRRVPAVWAEHDVACKHSQTKRIAHPEVGRLKIHCQTVYAMDQSQGVLVFTATPGTASAERQRLLAVLGRQSLRCRISNALSFPELSTCSFCVGLSVSPPRSVSYSCHVIHEACAIGRVGSGARDESAQGRGRICRCVVTAVGMFGWAPARSNFMNYATMPPRGAAPSEASPRTAATSD
jgi:MmyB-like transcription regulator ligand binding domain